MINFDELKLASRNWEKQKPFPHFVVDDFFISDIAKKLEDEIPHYDSDIWHVYSNAIEEKKTCNNWNVYPPLTYQVFQYLNSDVFVSTLSQILFGDEVLSSDCGLNGGGWHIHPKGGKLNTHLDYSIHPKLVKQRKINIIVYLNSSWDLSWGGGLGLWEGDEKQPSRLSKIIEPKFNRAAIFDTTCNSWHGLPDPLVCPENQYRKSIAVYYLTSPPENTDPRGKALFAPSKGQEDDKEVLDLIKKRSSIDSAADVWKEKN